jgi:SAM-dependent methyltransferase
LIDPARKLLEMSLGLLRARMLHAAAELGIADLLASGPLTAAALAKSVGANEDSLYRLLRALAAVDIFVELDDRTFALNETSQLLRSDAPGSARSLVRYFAGDVHARTYFDLIHSVRTGEPAFDRVHGMPLFDYLEQNEEVARLFDGTLERYAAATVEAVIAAYDFSGFARVVDVGGGKGQFLSALMRRHPSAVGVLFDRAHVIQAARSNAELRDISHRIELVPGDFFEAVPPDGDAYVLMHIIHDWDNDRAIRILSNCRRAMRPNGKVLLVEAVLKGKNEGAFAKLMDIGMLTTTGGAERTEEEHRDVLKRAGLQLVRVVQTDSAYRVLEAVSS